MVRNAMSESVLVSLDVMVECTNLSEVDMEMGNFTQSSEYRHVDAELVRHPKHGHGIRCITPRLYVAIAPPLLCLRRQLRDPFDLRLLIR